VTAELLLPGMHKEEAVKDSRVSQVGC
jgi:hypothetical protein